MRCRGEGPDRAVLFRESRLPVARGQPLNLGLPPYGHARRQTPAGGGDRPRLAGASDAWIQEGGREAEVLRLPGQQGFRRDGPPPKGDREHGAPECIRSDNGSELIAKAIQRWLKENGIKTLYIDPGCPWQNGHAESFNSRFREECLDRELIYTLSESRVIFLDWRDYDNKQRPHRSLGLLTPSELARKQLEGPPLRAPSAGRYRKPTSTTKTQSRISH